jgi:hypothetical protein
MRLRMRGTLFVAATLCAAGVAIGLRGGAPAGAQPQAAGQSAAALARLPQNRGKVVGAPCEYKDGYMPDFSALEAKARAALAAGGNPARPINVIDHAQGARPPLAAHELPAGRAYCLRTPEAPAGYLTMNCKTDGDCPKPSICQGRICRAACSADSECVAPAVCTTRTADSEQRFCRCDDCAPRFPDSAVFSQSSGEAPARAGGAPPKRDAGKARHPKREKR